MTLVRARADSISAEDTYVFLAMLYGDARSRSLSGSLLPLALTLSLTISACSLALQGFIGSPGERSFPRAAIVIFLLLLSFFPLSLSLSLRHVIPSN